MSVDILELFPSQINETEEARQIANAENPEFETKNGRIIQATLNLYPKLADERGIREFEQWLDIPSIKTDSLEARRAKVLAKLNETLPYTWIRLHRMLAALVGWGNFSLERKGARIIFRLLVPDPENVLINAVLEMFSRVIPMNLYWEFIHNPPTKMLPIRLGMGALMSMRTEIPEHKDYKYRRWNFLNAYMGARIRKKIVIH